MLYCVKAIYAGKDNRKRICKTGYINSHMIYLALLYLIIQYIYV